MASVTVYLNLTLYSALANLILKYLTHKVSWKQELCVYILNIFQTSCLLFREEPDSTPHSHSPPHTDPTLGAHPQVTGLPPFSALVPFPSKLSPVRWL